jgi:hypothetical protein
LFLLLEEDLPPLLLDEDLSLLLLDEDFSPRPLDEDLPPLFRKGDLPSLLRLDEDLFLCFLDNDLFRACRITLSLLLLDIDRSLISFEQVTGDTFLPLLLDLEWDSLEADLFFLYLFSEDLELHSFLSLLRPSDFDNPFLFSVLTSESLSDLAAMAQIETVKVEATVSFFLKQHRISIKYCKFRSNLHP